MAPIVEQHHHRSTTKTTQKPFKAKHATKSALKERSKGNDSMLLLYRGLKDLIRPIGKIERLEKAVRRTPHQHVMSKLERRNQAKQKRMTRDQEHAKATSVFSGRDAAPRIIAVVPLCNDVDIPDAIKSLSGSVDDGETVSAESFTRIYVDRFKQKIIFKHVRRALLAALDACRVADYVVFVFSAEQEVDSFGELLLKSIESQGVSNVFAAVQVRSILLKQLAYVDVR